MTEVVKFDIGGQKYKVSRSLLQMHPDSMLAKSASDQWQEDPEAEIFIEGDGSLFRYVLTYLRHGTVSLPITESKEALAKELEYYGIEVDENAIDEKATIKAKSVQSMRIALIDLKQYIADMTARTKLTEIDLRYAQLAHDCVFAYFERMKMSSSSGMKSHQMYPDLNRDEDAKKNAKALRILLNSDDEKSREGANVHLKTLGLHLKKYRFASGGYFASAVLEEIDTAQRNKGHEE